MLYNINKDASTEISNLKNTYSLEIRILLLNVLVLAVTFVTQNNWKFDWKTEDVSQCPPTNLLMEYKRHLFEKCYVVVFVVLMFPIKVTFMVAPFNFWLKQQSCKYIDMHLQSYFQTVILTPIKVIALNQNIKNPQLPKLRIYFSKSEISVIGIL